MSGLPKLTEEAKKKIKNKDPRAFGGDFSTGMDRLSKLFTGEAKAKVPKKKKRK